MKKPPGKYDTVCQYVKTVTDARIALVVVVGWRQNYGYSLQTAGAEDPKELANALEQIVIDIRKSLTEQHGTE